MSMSYVGIGFTQDFGITSQIANEESVTERLEKYRAEFEKDENIVQYDPAGFLDAADSEPFEALVYGAQTVLASDFPNMTFQVTPDNADVNFVVHGSETYGDNPFEGFDEVCLFVNLCSLIPALGKEFGILGGGIVIPSV